MATNDARHSQKKKNKIQLDPSSSSSVTHREELFENFRFTAVLPSDVQCKILKEYIPSPCKAFTLVDMPEFSEALENDNSWLNSSDTFKELLAAMRSFRSGVYFELGKSHGFLVTRNPTHFVQVSYFKWTLPNVSRSEGHSFHLETSLPELTTFIHLFKNKFVYLKQHMNLYRLPNTFPLYGDKCFCWDIADNALHWVDGKIYKLDEKNSCEVVVVVSGKLSDVVKQILIEVDRKSQKINIRRIYKYEGWKNDAFNFDGSPRQPYLECSIEPIFSNVQNSKNGFDRIKEDRIISDLTFRSLRDQRIHLALTIYHKSHFKNAKWKIMLNYDDFVKYKWFYDELDYFLLRRRLFEE